ncbi:MAG: helix-hairpin-helix domain-containing protein [Clostridiales bacterium]|jgi:putative DNA modification/repair radical SAM protein|nr:helix-hairpin-helix domain-containing protein [Clostridiales bacterium]
MIGINVKKSLSMEDIIIEMQQDASFDVADSDIGEEDAPDYFMLKNIKAPKAPPKVPKVFLSNDCLFNCAYCGCRCGNEERGRYCNDPKEMAKIAVEDAVKNRHGVFITSAIYKNPNYTEELIISTLKIIRQEIKYPGYIHAKIMPGTDPELIRQAGLYADRLSVNIEVAKSEGYEKIAKQKNKSNILTPMKQISDMVQSAKYEGKKFATSQTTQLMAGSTNEDDRTIMKLSKELYRRYKLKRVYYTAFSYQKSAKGYDLPFVKTPHWRMRRLYQADRLMLLYNFSPDEITPEEQPFLESDIDPKAAWAIRNLCIFPVEVNTADYELLLRVPGIGITYAKRIVEARKYCRLTHDILRKMGVSLKKSKYFITCSNKYLGGDALDSPVLRNLITDTDIEKLKLPESPNIYLYNMDK